MKKWLINNFLPMWAKETVLADNIRLKKENEKLKAKYERLRCYIDGAEFGAWVAVRIGERREGE